MGSLEINVYDGSIYPRNYGIPKTNSGELITLSKWNSVYNAINSERARRNNAPISYNVSNPIAPKTINLFWSGISYYWTIPTVSQGELIRSTHINDVIERLNQCGSVCICNCNYCTCNCNYCTCNCNYSCTCNCNYSDKRLKRNVKFIKKIKDVNVYEFEYLWTNEKYIGVIAQELIGTKYQSALRIDNYGFYKVDYSKLPKIKED